LERHTPFMPLYLRRRRDQNTVFDQAAYRERNKVERAINRINRYQRVATRYEALACMYAGMVFVSCLLNCCSIQAMNSHAKRKNVKFTMSLGVGVAFGMLLGAALDNVGLGLALGIALGAGTGSALEIRTRKSL